MARPSLKEERTEEILSAYEKCIVKYGVEGATSKKVAEIAGIARPLVRHHVGNNDELFDKLVERFIARTEKHIKEVKSKKHSTIEELYDQICETGKKERSYQDLIVARALTLRASRDEYLRKKMHAWFSQFNGFCEEILAKHFPKADQDDIETLAIIILNYYIASDALAPIGEFKELETKSKRLIRKKLFQLDKTNK